MKRILIFFSFLCLIACEDEEYSYSGKYVSESMFFSNVKVYTSTGEITDLNTIQQAVLNHFPEQFLLNSDTVIEAFDIIDIEFLSGDKAYVNYRNISEERDIKGKNGVLYIESDILSRYYNPEYIMISDKIFKYYPLISNTQPLPPSSGYSTYTEYKHCLYLLGYDTKIKFPFLTYVFVRNPSGDNIQTEGDFKNNNSFNKKALDFLVDGDTLILQEYYINLIKQ